MIELLRDFRNMQNTKSCFAFGEYLHVSFKEDSKSMQSDIINSLDPAVHKEIGFLKISPTIEDCFIQLMNK